MSQERPALRRDAEHNRRRTLEAAREVFAARGLQATLNDVAHHAGLGVGTVYRRFPNKEALAEVVYAGRLEDIHAAARAALEGPDAYQALKAVLEHVMEQAAADRGLRELIRRGAGDSEPIARARQGIVESCGRLIARAREQGAIRDDITVADLAPIVTMIDSVLDLPSAGPVQAWRRYLALILDGLRTGPERPARRPS
ncbi:TetR/AcrR family transcriptional regulator [Bailinhaonella thermotolerans]|uniref:TetR/AcrR family transcriptional regulator n=1 Tax=Bailinhaonella thermotolerans TaxID=1070861 RepID=A0A3A3ZX52_9ACTN|nr:TetR/AcrR family transcriptional regulator [Bailinhaonella thermotolerans]RJL19188.1 TetR/AcrR family transcriptional regulator [Bailinhaonella thermotolerans]